MSETDIKLAEPLAVEIGTELEPYLSGDNSDDIRKQIEKLRKNLKTDKGIKMPRVHITDNKFIQSDIFEIRVFGTKYSRCSVEGKDEFYTKLLHQLYLTVTENSECFSSTFKNAKKKLKRMLKKTSREAYKFLADYYTFIEPDAKERFHWLKKMAYFRVPSDLKELARCYRWGRGCKEDNILADKFWKKVRIKKDL
ncbi:MAG: FHIPEP family type III secretion protein [Treponema sp.]|nr:FHIPEP family type III secretion protein [Treponema sp.]